MGAKNLREVLDSAGVRPQEQFAVRAIVSAAPYPAMARESYRPGVAAHRRDGMRRQE